MIARRKGERADEITVAMERGYDPYNSADLPHVIAAWNTLHARSLSFAPIPLDDLTAITMSPKRQQEIFDAALHLRILREAGKARI